MMDAGTEHGSPHIKLTTRGAVATITIDRPLRRNAISQAMWLSLARMVDACGNDGTTLALVIRGAGADFSAGADITEFDQVRKDAASARRYEAANARAFAAVRNCPIPTIAAIRGICFGGGFGIAAACDIRIATADARFAVPAARLGLAYPAEAMGDIVGALGPQLARYLIFTASTLEAEAAMGTGFLLELTTAGEFDERIAEVAQAIAHNAPLTIKAAKSAIRAVMANDAAALERATRAGEATFDSEDYAEGRAAFRDRRLPQFKGR